MCFKREKEKREWVYVLDGCQVRVVFAPKVLRIIKAHQKGQEESHHAPVNI
jgi:hypothetical protein